MRTLETDLSDKIWNNFITRIPETALTISNFLKNVLTYPGFIEFTIFLSVSSISRNTKFGHVIQLVQAGVSITPSAANSIVTVRSTTSVFLTLQFCLYLLTSVTLVTLVSRVMSCLKEFLTNLLLYLTWTRTSTFDTNSLLLKTRMRYKLTDKKAKKDMSSTG